MQRPAREAAAAGNRAVVDTNFGGVAAPIAIYPLPGHASARQDALANVESALDKALDLEPPARDDLMARLEREAPELADPLRHLLGVHERPNPNAARKSCVARTRAADKRVRALEDEVSALRERLAQLDALLSGRR